MKSTLKALCCALLTAIGSTAISSDNILSEAKEVVPRAGVGNLIEKISSGQDIRVAYFGGSITSMDGWRRLSLQWLQDRYPKARFSEIQASIGGTGSLLGVFRYGQDVLNHRPDVVFVEFATNDANESPEMIWENFDGIVRQTWQRNSKTDIVFVYTITHWMMKDYQSGKCPRSASAMERLAEHYGIPSIGFGPRIAAGVKAGKVIMSMGEVATAVPTETPNRDRLIAEELSRQGKLLFSKDGVHPVLDGHRLFYLESFRSGWEAMEGLPPVDHAKCLRTPFYSATKERAKLVPIDAAMLKGSSWTKVDSGDPLQKRFGDRGGQFWLATKPGDRLTFRFKGTECLVYDLYGPDCGRVWVTVDGNRREKPIACFDEYSTYYRLCNLGVYKGKDGVHTVEIEVDPVQPDRTLVHRRDPKADVASEKFNGTKFYACKLMVVGDCVPMSVVGNENSEAR